MNQEGGTLCSEKGDPNLVHVDQVHIDLSIPIVLKRESS
jgi:hypothetical protein